MTMPKPHISEAQRICDRLKADGVVVLAFGDNQVAGASYGATKAQCKLVGEWMDMVIDRILLSGTLPTQDRR